MFKNKLSARMYCVLFCVPRVLGLCIFCSFLEGTSTAESMLSKTDWISPATLKKIHGNSPLTLGVKHA